MLGSGCLLGQWWWFVLGDGVFWVGCIGVVRAGKGSCIGLSVGGRCCCWCCGWPGIGFGGLGQVCILAVGVTHMSKM